MGATRTTSVKIPDDLLDALDRLYGPWGYESRHAALIGLIQYACLTGSERHHLTAAISREDGGTRDAVNAYLRHLVAAGAAGRTTLLEHLIHGAADGTRESLPGRLVEDALRFARENPPD